jgi:hypothetical protein
VPNAVPMAQAGGVQTGDEANGDGSSEGGETTCIICFTNPKTHLAAPCGHQCACEACSRKMHTCPYCREPVVMWVKTRVV